MKGRAKAANGLITVDEFYRLVPDGQKADLIDGVIYMASPDNIEANDLTAWFCILLGNFNGARRLGGKILVNRASFRLSEYRAPEPDVAFVRKKRLHLVGKQDVKGGPDVAVEIVSPDSRKRDYVLKKRLYEEAGVSEYWIIDPLKKRVELHRLRQGKYVLIPLKDGHILRSTVLRGFWLDVNWLFADPMPQAFDCIHEILSAERK